ncbi:unnamed protein product [Pylaiella littoralis]
MGENSNEPRAPTLIGNLPQSKEFMINTRHEITHFRTYAPVDGKDIKALVFFLHGYGGHCNAATKVRLGKAMVPLGFAMVQPDLPGHGYSEGERAYVERYSHWLDDIVQLLEAIAGGGFKAASEGNFCLSEGQLEQLKTVPIFMSGESLGGGLSLLTGLTLQDRQHALLPRFKGLCLVAPAIKGNAPPAPVVAFLRYFVAPVIPRRQIPDLLETVKNPTQVWKTEEDRAKADQDQWGKPGSLGWGHNMKFNMAMNMMDMIGVVHQRLSEVKFPFLVMHDPGDAIVQYAPVLELMEKASPPTDDPRARELKNMDGWLHDLLTNCPDLVIDHMSDWISYQVTRV